MLDATAERPEELDRDGGTELAKLFPGDDGRRRARERRDGDLGARHVHGHVLEAAVASRRARELSQSAPRRLDLDPDRRSRSSHLRRSPLELARRLAGERERVDGFESRLEPSGLDPGDERELVEELGDLPRGLLDHVDEPRCGVLELEASERPREPVHRRERRPQVVAGERDEAREPVLVAHPGAATVAKVEGRVAAASDLQASRPEVPLGLSRVGVTGVEKAVRMQHRGQDALVSATIDCFVDLDPDQKGVHMSRFPELFGQAIDELVIPEKLLVEQLAEHIAGQIVERQGACRAEVTIRARYPVERLTPVTGLETQELVTLVGIAAATPTEARRLVGVEATGINACPCAQGLVRERAGERLADAGFRADEVERILEIVPLATHNQRGRGLLYLGTRLRLDAEDLVEVVERSMSSPIYELLKRPDELFVVEHAHLTPRFVEDSVRLMTRTVLEEYGELADDDFVLARQVNFETIHNHEVLAERFGTVGDLRSELAGDGPARHTELRAWLALGT